MKRARDHRRGDAPLFLLCTLLLSCASGVGVYLFLKDRYAHSRTAEAATPRPAPTPAPVESSVVFEAIPVVEPPAPVPIVPEPATPSPDPEELTAQQVEDTIAAARHRFADCTVVGRLTLTLKIRPSGRVEQVTIDGSESDEMRTCVVSATKRIKFPRSTKGLTARYSLVGE